MRKKQEGEPKPSNLPYKMFIKWVNKKVKKLFHKLFREEKAGQFVQPLLYAAQEHAYIETVSNKADTLHRWINKIYEEDIQESYRSILAELAPNFRRGKVRLAIDFKEIGYYGKEDSFFIVGTAYGNKSYRKAFKFITISLLTGTKEERLPLYALPWHIGQNLTDAVTNLLQFIRPWFNNIEVVQFDRGFDSWELVYFLEQHKIPYLIHKIKHKGKISDLVKQTSSFYRAKYSRTFKMKKRLFRGETNLYIAKNVRGKDWVFISSLPFTKKEQLVSLYRNRWQIETNYAVSNQNRIMSKSANYMHRYFYFICDMLLQILWRLSGCVHLPFKTFLSCFVMQFKKILKPLLFKPPERSMKIYSLLALF